ncbi:MAG: hypothetical protein WA913_15330 [Pricia sp.]
MNRKAKKKKWWFYGSVGAALLGFGVCCAVESGFLKHGDEPWFVWVPLGTLSLCPIIAGVVFLVRAGILGHELKNTDRACEQ